MSAALATILRRLGAVAGASLLIAAALLQDASVQANVTAAPITISQLPLTIDIPAHPQVLIALGNSESMDGDMDTSLPGGGGAIMTGSGALTISGAAYLASSTSPVNFTVPANFTPPVNPGAGGVAPYTVTTGGVQYDNSPSRLNVAKAGISAILSNFMEYADFGLIDYSTTYDNCCGTNPYTTWVYYMSNPGGFTFTNSVPAGEYVANPCYNVPLTAATTVGSDCSALNTHYLNIGINTFQYMAIGASSDDPDINDILYATGLPPGWVNYDGPSNGNPYTHFSLANYEDGGVEECYFLSSPGGIGLCETPTNAGYVPYSTEVMQFERGFGYISTQSATSGATVVGMQSSGASPTAASTAAAIAHFTPYLLPETNSTATTEVKAVAIQSPSAGLLTYAKNYYTNVNPASSNGCAPLRYVVFVTDGLPTEDESGNAWPPLGTISATGYGVTATFNANGSLAATNDTALTQAINEITAMNTAGIKTYVIGLGAGVEPSVNPAAASTLTAMAVAGGTGSYFPATSPASLTNAMQVILAQILAATQSTASSTVNTAGLNTNSLIFQPSFDTSDVDQDWTGDIKAYPINPVNGVVNTASLDWSAQAQLDLQSAGTGWDTDRIIATWDPVAVAGIPFRWTAGTPASGIATSTVLGQELETNTADTDGEHALRYLRGDDHWELAESGEYRNRSHILADIVDSAPLYIGPATGPYQTSSYYAFEAQYANRQAVIYAGANDGMLHAINATTGQEMFAYIPNGVFANLINLTSPFYNEQHHFYVDGSPQAGDVQFNDGSWHTLLVSGERAGGSTMFALDVSNPVGITTEAVLASDVMWEFSDPNMGLSFSTPAIAQTAAGANTASGYLGFTVFFGNGYNSPSQQPYLYAVNAQTGASLPGTPINLCAQVAGACNSSLPNGLSSVVAVNDLGGFGAPATTVYAGDLQGNVWRVNISNASSTSWTVTLLFQATDPSGNRQPITTAPVVSLNPDFPRLGGTMVYVGTGQMLGIPDLGSTQVQTMYGVYDSGTNAASLTRANLVAETMSASVVGGQTLRFISGTAVPLPTDNGWDVNFSLLSGERIVTDPQLFGGAVIVTSVQPSSNTCTGGDQAYLMEFNFAGGAFSNPQFNYTGTGVIAPTMAPANGVYLGTVYASAPVFSNYEGATGMNGASGGISFVTESCTGSGCGNDANPAQIQGYSQLGLDKQRFAWSEIQ
jgi:type IV pilus assembly protein PilY1